MKCDIASVKKNKLGCGVAANRLANKNADSEGQGASSAVGVFMLEPVFVRVEQKSVGQSFSALCASSLEYISAVSSLHSLSEAMLLFSLALLRLISSEHRLHLLQNKSEAFRFSAIKYAFTQ